MPSQSHSHMLYSFIILLIVGSMTAYYANRKGKNPLLWFVLGMLIGLFAPLILFFLPSNKPEEKFPTMSVSNPDPSLAQLASPLEIPPSIEENKLWYYLDKDHQQMGPVSIIALRELWNRGQLELTSYVWSEGMDNWERVDNLPDLKAALNKL